MTAAVRPDAGIIAHRTRSATSELAASALWEESTIAASAGSQFGGILDQFRDSG